MSRRKTHLIAVAAAMALGAGADRALAVNLYWDANGATGGAGGPTPTGTWGTDHFWNPKSDGAVGTAAWSAGNTAVFAAGTDATGAYTVTVSGTQDAGGIQFEEGTATLSGGTVNLSGNSVVLAAAGAATSGAIDSVITGATGMNLTRVGTSGAVTLTLGGANTYTGQTLIPSQINGVGVILNHNAALGATGAGNETVFGPSSSSDGGHVGLPGNRLINENLQIRGGGQSANALGQLRNIGGVNTWAGNVVINGTNNTLGAGLASIGSSSGTLVVTGVISSLNAGANTAGVAWAKTGPGTVVLRSSNTNIGLTRPFNGTLVVEADGALGTPTVDGSFDGSTLELANNPTTIAFNAPPASSGFAYTVHEGITTAGPAASLGIGFGGNAQLDNFGGDNTFAGFVRVGGASVSGPNRVIASLGATSGSSLELSGDLFASTSGVGTMGAIPDPREIHKLGGGTLIISGANTAADGITSGDSDQYRMSGTFVIDAGTVTLRSTNASGGVLLGSTNGAMNFRVSAGTTLALDNSLAANGNRLASNAVVTVADGEFKLVGNAATSVTQTLANPSVTGNSTITVTQPGGSATTTLRIAPSSAAVTMRAATLNLSAGAKLDLTDNKLIAAGQSVGTWNGSAYTGITGLVQSGRGDGSWNGKGITTSMTDATTGVLTTLAVGEADDLGYAGGTFAGVSVSAGDTIVFYTWGGDADLNGELNGDDYFWIDSHILQSGSVFGFHRGDFNYDGAIDGDDYFILDSNILYAQGSGYVFPHGAGSTGSPQAGAGLTGVPEPGVGLIIMATGISVMRRRGARGCCAPP